MSEQPIKGLVFDMDGLLLIPSGWYRNPGMKLEDGMPGFGEQFGDHIYHTIGFNVVRRTVFLKNMSLRIFQMEEFQEKIFRRIYHKIMEDEGVGTENQGGALLQYPKDMSTK